MLNDAGMYVDMVTPFHELTLMKVREIVRRTGRPARTVSVATGLGKPTRTMRWHLKRMEALGLLARPKGIRSGWAVPDDRWGRRFGVVADPVLH